MLPDLGVGIHGGPHTALTQVEADRLQHIQVMGHLVPQRLRAVDDVLQETMSEKGPPGCFSQFLQAQGPTGSAKGCNSEHMGANAAAPIKEGIKEGV